MAPKHKKIVVVIAVLVVAVGAATLLWRHFQSKRNADEVVLYGNVDIRQVSLAFNANERIAELLVQEGDRVKAGQLLGRLDLRTLRLHEQESQARIAAQEQVLARLKNGSRPQEIQESQARTRAAEADAQLAVENLNRLEATFKSTEGQGVARSELDAARAKVRSSQAQAEALRRSSELVAQGPRNEDVKQAEAQLNAARAELALTQRQLQEGELKSPVDAVVRSRLMEPGDMASPQKPVFALAISHPKWIRAYVTGEDLHRVKPGQPASVQADGLRRAVPGSIGYISSVAEFTPKTVQTEELRTSLVYEVRVNIDDPDDALRLGQPVTVRLNSLQRQ
ncbi:HlyD family efflux transporter periplasmic adaptor subunit [Stutzerimonas kunmingensis]|uniref:HlyD family efflux transporter periplasmic adaptor subunit n=1 Tax=Stutzerimonas kunmingensis TaxID=1211807 RepID=UPI0028A2BBE2|nr:HlyD family efflux transporter periplasmic adaptor subunit [Stutzerimonas kunmingensis]